MGVMRTKARKRSSLSEAMTKKVVNFFSRKNRVTPTKPSGATGVQCVIRLPAEGPHHEILCTP